MDYLCAFWGNSPEAEYRDIYPNLCSLNIQVFLPTIAVRCLIPAIEAASG
jgi:hypothetical protein